MRVASNKTHEICADGPCRVCFLFGGSPVAGLVARLILEAVWQVDEAIVRFLGTKRALPLWVGKRTRHRSIAFKKPPSRAGLQPYMGQPLLGQRAIV